MARGRFLLSVVGVLGTVAGCAPMASPPTVPIQGSAVATYVPVQASPAAPPPSVAQAAEAPVAKREADRDQGPREQPGLGTEWGETRRQGMTFVSFDREDPRRPMATASLLYNDDEGARALVGGAWPMSYGMVDTAKGLVKIGLRDDTGKLFPGFVSGNKDVVVGEAGRRYTILLHNNTDRRMEVVLTVDGLDVKDGRPASFDKRGYILESRADLEIDGFRQSLETVASFRFGSVRGSYAGLKYGDVRNVGVIGVALFAEKGSLPFPWTPEEVRRRKEANPFPGELAAPTAY